MKSTLPLESSPIVRAIEHQYRVQPLVQKCCNKLGIGVDKLFKQVCLYLQGEVPGFILDKQRHKYETDGFVDYFFEKTLRQIADGVVSFSPPA